MLTSRSRRPRLLGDVGADPLRRVGVGQVGGDVGRLAGQRLGERPQPLLAAGDEDQLGARLAGQAPRRRLADSARGAGDHALQSAWPHGKTYLNLLYTRYSADRHTARFVMAKTPKLLDELLRAGAPSGLRGPRRRGLARRRLLRRRSPPTASAPRSPGSARRARCSPSSATSTRSASSSPTSTRRASSTSARSAAGTRRSSSASGSRSAAATASCPASSAASRSTCSSPTSAKRSSS